MSTRITSIQRHIWLLTRAVGYGQSKWKTMLLCALLFVASPALAKPQHAITPFGEPKYSAHFRHFDYVNPDAPKGGTLRLAETLAFNNLNPYILKGITAPGMSAVFETLMVPSLDEPQTYYGLIAQSIDLAPDRRFADFTLRREAHWHDGKPITADDVVFSLTILKEKGHPAYQILYQPIEKAEKTGPYQVRIYFNDPTNRELPILAAALPVLPKHYYEQVPFDKTSLKPPVGSGPYQVAAVNQGRRITFERVKDYWGKDLPVNRGQYNFDRIIYDVFRDETVSVEAIKSGQYDFREEYIARNWATAYEIDAVKQGKLKKERIPHQIPRGMQAFLFNTRQSKFADARVREAIGLSMDYEWMNKTLFYNAYTRSNSFFQNTRFMAPPLPDDDELAVLEPYRDTLPESWLTEPLSMPKTDGSGYPREQLLKAQALLQQAGWVIRDGKRTNAKTGEILTVEFMMRQRTFERAVGSMIRNLNKLGIDATFRYVDDSQYQKRVESRDFDIVSIWWNMGVFFPGNEQISFWHSTQADLSGSQNLSGLKDPVVDGLLAALTQAETLEQLTSAAHALDRVLLKGHYVIPHWHLAFWRILYWDKFGQPEVRPSYGLPIYSWWSREHES